MRTTRRYFGCCTSRWTSTTIVFSIFALVTLPVSTVRSPRSAAALCVSVVITPSLPFVAAQQPTVPVRAEVFSPAPDPFSLRATASALPLVRWKAGTAAGKSAPSNPCAAPAARLCLLRGSSQFAAASLKPSRAGNEFRRDRQLVRRQTHGFFCCRFVYARHLKHDASRLHHRHPLLRRAFAFAHARFRRFLGKRLVRENPDPQFSAALDEARNRHARCLNLPVRDPCAFHGLQSIVAKREITAAPRFSVAPAAHLLSVLHFLRHQHRSVLASRISSKFLRRGDRFAFLLNLGNLLGYIFALIHPALHANYAVRRLRFRGTVINVRAQCLQRQPSLQIPLFARDFRAIQPARHAHLDALAAEAQRRIHRFAHCAPERHALFELQRDRFRHELRIQLRTVHFQDVNVHFAFGALLHVLLQLVDLRALAPDDDAGPRGVNAHDQFVGGALDVDRAD